MAMLNNQMVSIYWGFCSPTYDWGSTTLGLFGLGISRSSREYKQLEWKQKKKKSIQTDQGFIKGLLTTNNHS